MTVERFKNENGNSSIRSSPHYLSKDLRNLTTKMRKLIIVTICQKILKKINARVFGKTYVGDYLRKIGQDMGSLENDGTIVRLYLAG